MTSKLQRITDRASLPSLSSPETDTLDWKKEVDPKKRQELAKDIAAMANASGGSIVVGVKEGSTSVPVALHPLLHAEARALATAYEHAARDSISPPAKIDACIIELEHDGSGKFVLAINIHPTESIFCGIRATNEGSKQIQDNSWQIPQRVASQTKYLNPAEAQSKTVERLRSATQRTLSLIENWQDDLSQKEAIRRFEDFMAHGTRHNIRLTELTTKDNPIGLEYTIQPARDIHGSALHSTREARNRWIIEVIGPAYANVLTPQELEDYDNSPIRDGEFYYCEFHSGSWHIFNNMWTQHAFYLTVKDGTIVEHLESANNFVERHRAQNSTEPTRLFQITLQKDGTPGERGNLFSVFKTDLDKLFLRINDSPAKPIYLTTPKGTYINPDWYLEIESLRGYGDLKAQKAIRQSIHSELERLGISVPRIPWYNTSRAGQP